MNEYMRHGGNPIRIVVTCCCLGWAAWAVAQDAAVDPEAELFEMARHERFQDLVLYLQAQGGSSPYSKLLLKPAQKLSNLHRNIVDAIQSSDEKLLWKLAQPDSSKDGVIVGATLDRIMVEDAGHTRRLVWNSLPGLVRFRITAYYLKKIPEAERVSTEELAEALGLAEAVEKDTPGLANRIKRIQAVQDALLRGDLKEARNAADELKKEGDPGPWGAAAVCWYERLKTAVAEREKKQHLLEEALPKGSVLNYWEDFERGPSLLSSQWFRGTVARSPDPAEPGQWCHQTSMVGKRLPWGEMILAFRKHPEDEAEEAFCKLAKNQVLSLRIWADNASQIQVMLYSQRIAGKRTHSVFPVSVSGQGQWTQVQVRIGDLKTHKPGVQWEPGTTLILDSPIAEIGLTAFRKDKNTESGRVFVDDLMLFTLPEDAAPSEEKAVKPPLPPDEEF